MLQNGMKFTYEVAAIHEIYKEEAQKFSRSVRKYFPGNTDLTVDDLFAILKNHEGILVDLASALMSSKTLSTKTKQDLIRAALNSGIEDIALDDLLDWFEELPDTNLFNAIVRSSDATPELIISLLNRIFSDDDEVAKSLSDDLVDLKRSYLAVALSAFNTRDLTSDQILEMLHLVLSIKNGDTNSLDLTSDCDYVLSQLANKILKNKESTIGDYVECLEKAENLIGIAFRSGHEAGLTPRLELLRFEDLFKIFSSTNSESIRNSILKVLQNKEVTEDELLSLMETNLSVKFDIGLFLDLLPKGAEFEFIINQFAKDFSDSGRDKEFFRCMLDRNYDVGLKEKAFQLAPFAKTVESQEYLFSKMSKEIEGVSPCSPEDLIAVAKILNETEGLELLAKSPFIASVLKHQDTTTDHLVDAIIQSQGPFRGITQVIDRITSAADLNIRHIETLLAAENTPEVESRLLRELTHTEKLKVRAEDIVGVLGDLNVPQNIVNALDAISFKGRYIRGPEFENLVNATTYKIMGIQDNGIRNSIIDSILDSSVNNRYKASLLINLFGAHLELMPELISEKLGKRVEAYCHMAQLGTFDLDGPPVRGIQQLARDVMTDAENNGYVRKLNLHRASNGPGDKLKRGNRSKVVEALGGKHSPRPVVTDISR